MGTYTTNYSFFLPTVGGDTDSWGDASTGLNGNWTSLDTELKSIADDLATAIQKDGSISMTGQLTLVGDPVTDSDAARKKYVDDQVATKVSINGSDDFTGAVTNTGGGFHVETNTPRFSVRDMDGSIFVDAERVRVYWTQNDSYMRFVLAKNDFTSIDTLYQIELNASGALAHTLFGPSGNARINYTTTTDLPTDDSIVTRERGDARYVEQSDVAAKLLARITINGATGATRQGSGLSCSRTSTGNYLFTLSPAASGTTYSVNVSLGFSGSGDNRAMAYVDTSSKSTSQFRVYVRNVNNVAVDPVDVYVTVAING